MTGARQEDIALPGRQPEGERRKKESICGGWAIN